MMPPAAPEPTITKSTRSEVSNFGFSWLTFGLSNDEWCSGVFDSSYVTRHSSFVIGDSVVVTKGGLEGKGVLEADQFPSDPVLVASVFGTGEKSHDRMEAHELEK